MGDPIDVKAPDGSVVRFPAGTSDDLINSEMSKAYAQGKFGQPRSTASTNDATAQKPDGAAPTEPTWGDRFRHAGAAIDDSVRAIANGIPFMDRIAAAGGAATGIGGTFGDYSGNLARQRGEDQRLEKEAPAANTLAHVTGGVLSAAAAAPLAAASAPTGLGILAKTGIGAATGAGLGAVQGVSDAPDLTDVGDVAKRARNSGAIGAFVGAGLPASGQIIGKGVNAMADLLMNPDGMSRGASKPLVEALQADGPAVVDQKMKALGLGAMLADGGPALQGRTIGAALNSDEARSTVFNALKTRDQATNQRILSVVDDAMGPAEDPQTVTNAIRARRSEADAQNYGRALNPQTAPAVNTNDMLAELGQQLDNSTGIERQALLNLRGQMMREMPDGRLAPQTNPTVLHKIKGEMDGVIEYDQPGLGIPGAALSQRNGALKHMRFMLNDALETQVPGYAEANSQSAALARRADAVQAGTGYLGNGKTTPSPSRFADEFEPMEQGEKIAFAKGSRGNIDRVLGTRGNDLQALRGELQGEGGWNTAKMATVHGQDAADALVNAVDQNQQFRGTYDDIVRGAQTAQRTAAKEAMAPAPPKDFPLINPNMTKTGFILTSGKKLLNAAYRGLQPDQTRHYGEIADILTAQGPERDQHLKALADALTNYNHNAQVGPTIGNRAALAAALLADESLRDRAATR